MKTIDLFAGCGGFSLGFQNEGFEIIAAFDKWEKAIEIYKKKFNHPIYQLNLGDETALDLINSFHPDIIIGGPPCQDFSSAGKQKETIERADLTLSFAKIVAKTKSKWFVMENVARIKKSNILKKALLILQNANYGLTQSVLDASLCGVPQKRKRFFLIGRLNGKDNEMLSFLHKNQSKKAMTLIDYFDNSLGLEYYYRHPRSYQRRGIFSIYEPSPTVRGVNRPMPKTYQKHKGDKCSPHKNIRALTTIERSYIQTFPENFFFSGTKTNLEQMIGNAVPVKLAQFVANCILQFEEDKTKKQNNCVNQVGQFEFF